MSDATALRTHSTSAGSVLARVLLAVVLAAALLASAVLVAGQLLPGSEKVKIALAIAWLGVVGLAIGRAAKSRPALRPVTRGAMLLATLAIVGWYLLSLRGEDVQEKLVAVPAAQPSAPAGEAPGSADRAGASAPALVAGGRFSELDHPGEGAAEVIRADGALTLQLRDFETDAGPDLRVYLSTDTDGSDFVDLGALKGNSGNQIYDVPAGTDTREFGTVLIWCRAFAVGFTAAELKPG